MSEILFKSDSCGVRSTSAYASLESDGVHSTPCDPLFRKCWCAQHFGACISRKCSCAQHSVRPPVSKVLVCTALRRLPLSKVSVCTSLRLTPCLKVWVCATLRCFLFVVFKGASRGHSTRTSLIGASSFVKRSFKQQACLLLEKL